MSGNGTFNCSSQVFLSLADILLIPDEDFGFREFIAFSTSVGVSVN